MELIVSHKSGFISSSPEVQIEKDGMPFYYMKRKGRFIMFNMPVGNYELVKGLVTAKPFIDYPLLDLPDVKGTLPTNIKIHYKENPNKCSVDISNKKVMHVWFDNSFKHFPSWVRDWILGHEAGHYLYHGHGLQSEINCDLFACNVMFAKGLNPSQIQAAIDCALGEKMISEHRKEFIYKSLQTVEDKLHNLKIFEDGRG